MKYIKAFLMAFSMFCAIPCPYRPWDEEARPLMSAFLAPVGLVIGCLWALVAYLGKLIDIPVFLLGAVIAFYPYCVTGFLHLDGFIDTVDAVLSHRDRENRLKILKDSHVGAFGVISVCILLIVAFASGATLCGKNFDCKALIAIPICTRASAAFAISQFKPLAHSQYSGKYHSGVSISIKCVMISELALALALSFILSGALGLCCALTAAVFYALFLFRAGHNLGGVSGDLSGYALTLGEIAGLIVLAIFS